MDTHGYECRAVPRVPQAVASGKPPRAGRKKCARLQGGPGGSDCLELLSQQRLSGRVFRGTCAASKSGALL